MPVTISHECAHYFSVLHAKLRLLPPDVKALFPWDISDTLQDRYHHELYRALVTEKNSTLFSNKKGKK